MTTKYLTGAYHAGYQVQPGVTYLDVESTASVGGYGVRDVKNNAVHIENDGAVNATGAYGMSVGGSDSVVNGKSNPGALIEGGKIGFAAGGEVALSNYGTIISRATQAGLGMDGVVIAYKASVVNGSANDTAALIQGASGIFGGYAGAVTNYATIVGTAAYGTQSVETVTNGSSADPAATIQGGQVGVKGSAGGRLTNFGVVTGGGCGVEFLSGGSISNFGTLSGGGSKGVGIALYGDSRVVNGGYGDLTALIEGGQTGLYAEQDGAGLATIVNYATIEATGANGFGALLHQGTFDNGGASDISALIEGAVGVSVANAEVLLLRNGGVIRGTAGAGLMVSGQRNVIVNGSSGDQTALIVGVGPGMVDTGEGDTVINYGTIAGLTMTGPGGLLEVAAQSDFGTGPVTIDGTLELMGGTGTLSGLADGVTVSGSMATTAFDGFEVLQVGTKGAPVSRNAHFTLTGSGVVAADQTLTVWGRLTVKHDLTIAGSIGGFPTGVIGLAVHATAEFEQATPTSLTVSLRASPSLLELTDPSQFGATIGGMVHHGKIDLLGVAADAAMLEAGDKLAITDGGAAVATLQLAGNFGADTFTTTSDGAGGTFVSVVRAKDGAVPPTTAATIVHPFIAAAASFGAEGGGSAYVTGQTHAESLHTSLAGPRIQTA